MRPHPAPDGPQAGEDSSGASDLVPPTRSAPPPAAAAAAAAKADAGLAERDEASALTVAGTGPAAGGSSHGSDGEPAARGPLPALDPGALVDHRYRVLRELGAGGFAAVYLVEDLFDEGRVRALKLLRPRSRFAQRAFRAEFRVLAGLDHPGLARVHEFGQLPGAALYFTQEFVPGLPMHRARLQGGADADLPDLVLQVCAALGYIHENGVLHRDVKPSNLIVTPPDEPSGRRAKLLDFGLAGVISPGRVAPVAGTLRYLAPEILREEHADQRADLYSLGATLYTVVAGRPPFLGSEDELVRAVCTTEAPPLPITVPRWLVRLCLALLAKDPAERPASAAEVAGLVARWTGRAPGGSAEALQGPSVREAPVAGREEERRALLAVYAVAAHGWADHENEPRVVVLRGETGSGKGRILRTLRHEVQLHGGTFYEAAFRDRAAGPLEPIADVLGRALAQAGWEEKVLPDDREALGRLLPELAQHARVRRRTFAVEAADERRRMAAAVYETLCRLFARRPGVLAFEEARWAGRDAVDVLLDVATLMQRDAHPPRLLVVLATRPGTIVEEALAKAGLCRTLALGPLGDEEVRGIVRGALGAAAAADEGLVRDVVALSGGNPLHALEALRLRAEGGRLPDGGAPALDEVVRARLMLRPPPAQEILATLAVLGKPVPLELLLQASPTPPAEPLRALRPLLDGGLLRVTRGDAGPLYGFAREIYRRVAEELVGTDAARARIRHRRAAAALARSKPDERSVDAAGHHSAVAYHWEQAGMADRALQQHRRAAAAATEQLANGVAIVHVEAAVRLGRRLGGAARLAEL
ncbi:MAG TPA: protein kinase, partial [Myxococcota bacterium]|nr:protein kinase [Myxococcota bacterium]